MTKHTLESLLPAISEYFYPPATALFYFPAALFCAALVLTFWRRRNLDQSRLIELHSTPFMHTTPAASLMKRLSSFFALVFLTANAHAQFTSWSNMGKARVTFGSPLQQDLETE